MLTTGSQQSLLPEGPVIVFDVETQRLFQELGSARQPGKLGLSVAVSYNVDADTYHDFTEETVGDLIDQVFSARLVIGYNILKFDYPVLKAYTDRRFNRVPTLDLFDHLYRRTGYRSGLNTVAASTLGEGKTGDGVEAVTLWREGKIDELLSYCRADVRLTYEVYKYGLDHGAVYTRDRSGRKQRVAVGWGN